MNCKYCKEGLNESLSAKVFCDNTCRRRYIKDGEYVPKTCKCCNVLIPREAKADRVFCSKKCKDQFFHPRVSAKEVITRNFRVVEYVESDIKAIRTDKGIVLLDNIVWEQMQAKNIFVSKYPKVNMEGAILSLHHIVMYCIEGKFSSNEEPIDHINRNKLDATYMNLRWSTKSGNSSNVGPRNKASGLKGVHRTASGKWQAMIWHEGKNVGLGSFDTCREAAQVYNFKAVELKGVFAYQNKL